jgi:tetratricopeptide (TPR) repeat protein
MRIESIHDALAFFPDLDGYWQPDNLAETEFQILSQLNHGSTEPMERTAKSVELLTQLARAQGLLGKIPDAQSKLDQARVMMTELDIKMDSRTGLRWQLEQARVFCLSMTLAKAHELFLEVWNVATKTDQVFYAIDAALMLSTIRPPKYQNEWLQKAITLAATTKDENAKLWMAQLLFLDGWHAFDFRQFEKALQSFDKALAEPFIMENENRSLPLKWSRARTLRALGRVPEALAIQEGILTKMTQSSKTNGHVYLEIAECQQLMKLHPEAKANFELAYAALSGDGWYSDNKTDELSRMKYLSKKQY